ncbi:cytochrome-c oxidase, cbb3-type subunit III [Afifella sp. IM 167]|uniref:cytochrome-c oxidase, cbb3-type subunit III n=1 Tax=Afifella sp. IM 167 TaxID=2033586 RepID=UPI001CCC4515|nr:cytochrome-c oxidase, cbb3-type subunit III [Afifella sp. IM 167]MBZ8132077.1 cytochrome-c oxidase, cbb3-type subunit III [Afifella sp. IM 167]
MATNEGKNAQGAGGPRHSGPEIDKATGQSTTGHEWDGIKELNTPLPRWWLWVFYACTIYALVYVVLYPAIPLIKTGTTGLLGWHSRSAVARELSEVEAARAGVMEKIRTMPLEEIAADPDLSDTAFRAGQSAFKVNCVQCHGSGAEGGFGYANLNDDDWIWGGTLEDIHTTIQHGIRYDQDPETRISEMPAFGRDGLLDQTQIAQVTQYVLSLSGLPHDAAEAEAGSPLFAENCAVCHGENGEGQQMLGAPTLNDAVWLYSADPKQIASQINNPKHGVMPAWAGRLDEGTIKQLTIYVHGLGGGVAAEQVSAN